MEDLIKSEIDLKIEADKKFHRHKHKFAISENDTPSLAIDRTRITLNKILRKKLTVGLA